MVTRMAMNLGCPKMANLAYLEGEVSILGLDHFVHAHICNTHFLQIINSVKLALY
jgi:hypothetical protein